MIYVLELEQGKYYVGYTECSTEKRIMAHVRGSGAEWTRRYKPVRIVGTLDGDTETESDVTLWFMREHGWENVRGGKWTRVDMRNPPNEFLRYCAGIPLDRHLICATCQRRGHHAGACTWAFDHDGDTIMS